MNGTDQWCHKGLISRRVLLCNFYNYTLERNKVRTSAPVSSGWHSCCVIDAKQKAAAKHLQKPFVSSRISGTCDHNGKNGSPVLQKTTNCSLHLPPAWRKNRKQKTSQEKKSLQNPPHVPDETVWNILFPPLPTRCACRDGLQCVHEQYGA